MIEYPYSAFSKFPGRFDSRLRAIRLWSRDLERSTEAGLSVSVELGHKIEVRAGE